MVTWGSEWSGGDSSSNVFRWRNRDKIITGAPNDLCTILEIPARFLFDFNHSASHSATLKKDTGEPKGKVTRYADMSFTEGMVKRHDDDKCKVLL